MEPQEYVIMFASEEQHWWYCGLHDLICKTIAEISVGKKLKLLDAGCGTGRLLQLLSQSFTQLLTLGCDCSGQALAYARKRKQKRLSQASVTEIPFADNSFDIITSLDVIYHQAVKDDADALREFYRALKPGGKLILNLPAYECLRSSHDTAVHTARRYSARDFAQKLVVCGFSPHFISYRNTFLFPLAAIVRLGKKLLHPCINTSMPDSDLKPLPGILNSLLYSVLQRENYLLMRRVKLPFGLSLFCLAEKKVHG